MLGLSFDSARMVTSCGPRENHNTREPNPMRAGFPAHFVDGHHHQIRKTFDLALTVVKVANALERQSPLAAIRVECSRELSVICVASVIAGAMQRLWPTIREMR
jgi:hypothetical protein